MSVPIPEEFQRQPDSYEPLPEIWVDADYYLDGVLVHPSRRPGPPVPPEEAPGWTVQGGSRGQAS